MSDLISTMFVTIMNAYARKKELVDMPSSKVLVGIAKLFKKEGYIVDYKEILHDNKKTLKVYLSYRGGEPSISILKRVSKSSKRVYTKCKDLVKFYNGLGVVILSTNAGIITDDEARSKGLGGEILGVIA